MITCCYHCQDRHQGCHGECEKYAEFRARVDEARKAERADSLMSRVFRERYVYIPNYLKKISGKHIYQKK